MKNIYAENKTFLPLFLNVSNSGTLTHCHIPLNLEIIGHTEIIIQC